MGIIRQGTAYELNGKIFCEPCYFKKIESMNLDDSPFNVITWDKWEAKRLDDLFYCDECNAAIYYDKIHK